MKLLFVCVCIVLLAACAATGTTNNAAYDLELAKGRATSAAVETAAQRSANAIATNDARTQVAANHEATRAAQAQNNALLYAQATNTAQSQFAIATSTAQYLIARGAETAQAEHARYNATRTARASDATATSDAHRWQTTATAERRTIEAQMQIAQATATAQVLIAQVEQTKADAEQTAQWNALAHSIARLAAVVLASAFLLGAAIVLVRGAFALVRYFDSRTARQWFLETRAGTIQIIKTERGTYAAALVNGSPNLLDAPEEDYFDMPSEVPPAREIPVRTISGSTFTMTDAAPGEETGRRLALRLLRESMTQYKQRGFKPEEITRIMTWRDLDWSADTWARAIDLLRPYLIVKQGRGGDAFCGPHYPNLLALYGAIGERRVALSPEALSRVA